MTFYLYMLIDKQFVVVKICVCTYVCGIYYTQFLPILVSRLYLKIKSYVEHREVNNLHGTFR